MFVLLVAFARAVFYGDRVVEGRVMAGWNETRLVEEALAFMQDVDHAAYWDAIDALAERKGELEDVIGFARGYLNEEQIVLLNMSQQIRFYSPRVEMLRQTLREKELPVVMCGNARAVDLGNVDACASKFFDFEPVFGAGNASLVLYVDVAKGNWKDVLRRLQNSDVRFAVRAVSFSERPMELKGCGAQMRPYKYSMEFNVKDQSHVIPSSQKRDGDGKRDFPLEMKLDQRFEEIDKEKLPFQIASFMRNATDPIRALKEILTNFPVFAQQINKMKVSKSAQRNFVRNGQFVLPGESALFVNGRKLDERDLSFHSIYQTLLQEYITNNILADTLGMDDGSLKYFRKTGYEPKIPPRPVLDARSNMFVYWLNDPDTDEKCAMKYPRSLMPLARDVDHFPLVARNAANAIFILDPSDADDLATIANIDELVSQGFPVHFGYTIAPVKRNPVAKKIYYAYVHVVMKYGMKAAHRMLMKVNNMRTYDEKNGKRGPVKRQFWETAFGSIAIDRRSPSFKTLNDLFKPESDESRFLQRLHDHVDKLGLEVPALILNGKFIEEKSPEKYLNQMLDEEMPNLRDLLARRKLSDATKDIHDVVLSNCGATPRYNKLIQRQFEEFSETIDLQSQNLQNQRAFVRWMGSINYQYGTTSGIKMQTFWIFSKDGLSKEVERYMSDLGKAEETRISMLSNTNLPKIVNEFISTPEDKVTVVFNGRIVHFEPSRFSRFDLQLLLDWEKRFSTIWAEKYLEKSAKKRSLGNSRSVRELSDCLLYMTMIVSHLAHENQPRTGAPYKTFKNGGTNLFKSPMASESLDVHLIMNPLTVCGQRMSCLLSTLRQFTFELMMNPPYDVTKSDIEILGTFYSDCFTFSFFNESTTYSVIPDVPRTWKLRCEQSNIDLDSLVASDLAPGVHDVTFQLQSIILEGYTSDSRGRTIPGLTLYLITPQHTQCCETRAISSNGYWQLPAHPGIFTIRTNSKETFAVKIHSFLPTIRMFECLPDTTTPVNETADNRVHVFVVSSGLLYERLSRIMMLSATRSTKLPIKFWILENFVSPDHRTRLPELANRYGFEYTFVSYQWPRWLPIETAPNRLIWGYKILFLDVMFPSSLRRVIYIDSDDVVRGDLAELMRLDLSGAPYAFTPFCEDRPEMEEYRFWNDGYWRNLLNGLSYHISALFVVDLVQFRRQDTGTLIRKAYSDLQSDPHSLRNLDQDLPNLLQTRGARIFSLPPEWLWCGSWCSDTSMPRAKVIDLCNNPRTKVSKLDYARSTIPEWAALDTEVNAVPYENQEL